VFNLIRLMMLEYLDELRPFISAFVDELGYTPLPRSCLVKAHSYNDRLARKADLIVYSYRDIRDVLASLYRKFGDVPTVNRAKNILQHHQHWTGCADITFRYESLAQDTSKLLATRIADHLGIADADVSAILIKLETLGYESQGPKNSEYHQVNHYHKGHITDGRHGSWEGWLEPELLHEIEDTFADWFDHHGYERTS